MAEAARLTHVTPTQQVVPARFCFQIRSAAAARPGSAVLDPFSRTKSCVAILALSAIIALALEEVPAHCAATTGRDLLRGRCKKGLLRGHKAMAKPARVAKIAFPLQEVPAHWCISWCGRPHHLGRLKGRLRHTVAERTSVAVAALALLEVTTHRSAFLDRCRCCKMKDAAWSKVGSRGREAVSKLALVAIRAFALKEMPTSSA
mmetsp:Transcript_45640/g.74116  ORF Transcript_45640/g.74116 Transcript_45640/m.74116 type:complete len:204 (+) Transcript_45640:233-844(+)